MNSRSFAGAATCAVAVGLAACIGELEGPVQAHGEAASLSVGQASCAPALAETHLEELIVLMRADVDELLAAGVIEEGRARALTNHLDAATRHLVESRYCPMRAALNSFRRQLDQLVEGGELSDREAYEMRHNWRLMEAPTERVPETHVEAYAPGVIGEPRSIQVSSGEFRYEVIDGLAIFGGDGILGYADEFEAGVAASPPGASVGESGPALAGVCSGEFLFFCNRWPDQTVHYNVVGTWGDPDTNAMMAGRVARAVRHIEENTGLNFERSFGDHMLVFRNATGCSSWIGMEVFKITDPQFVNLSTDCPFGSVVHEIGHALGVYHETARGDRDDWVRVDFGQVQEGSREQFYQYLDFGNDIGEYDYGSIMQYPCNAFDRDGATGPTVEPIMPGFGCADIGQRVGLSDQDIFGIYRLYPPEYRIVGAEPEEIADRFELSVEFSTKPVRDDYIVWRVSGADRGTGPTFSTVDAGILPGRHPVLAMIRIGGEILETELLWITIAENAPPVVDLGPDREALVGETVTLFASVSDPEDGSCPVTVCGFVWDPAPAIDRGGAADYVFGTPGEYTVSVTVEDGTGGTGSDELRITVAARSLVPVITSPSPGQSFNPGATTTAAGYAMVGDVRVACDRLSAEWTSSDVGDVVDPAGNACGTDITFGATAGPRTLTLTASAIGGTPSGTGTVVVRVDACDGSCAPDVSFEILPDAVLDGSSYNPPFTGPGYYLTTRLEIRGQLRDPDALPGEPIDYEVTATPPCFFGVCEPISVAAGSGIGPIEFVIPWLPASDIERWINCPLTALPYEITVSARDASGAQRETSRIIHLACEFR